MALNIIVDLDGIVTDTLPTWLNRIYETTGVKANPEDITRWNLHENPALASLKPEQLFGILNESNFNLNLPEMPGACATLKELQDDGHNITLVTARFGNNCMSETLLWLRNNMPWLNLEKQVIFCYDKHRIKADVIIDDKAETLVKYHKEHPNAHLIAITYPYNVLVPPKTHLVLKNENAWKEIKKLIIGADFYNKHSKAFVSNRSGNQFID